MGKEMFYSKEYLEDPPVDWVRDHYPWKVYHSIHMDPRAYLGERQPFPDNYELVARVHAEKIEDVFFFTNTVHKFWWTWDSVLPTKRTRSTSVGDVVVDERTNQAFHCEVCGWKEVEYGEV
jgi:hypothetical protein